jgi:hypothetical protein
VEDQVRCSHCGTFNAHDSVKCRVCGNAIDRGDAEGDKCPSCGFERNTPSAEKCIACGRNLTATRAAVAEIQGAKPEVCEHWSERPSHEVRTAKVGIAGILILMAGALGVAHGLLALLPETGGEILSSYESFLPPGEVLDDIMRDSELLSALVLIFGIMAVAMSTFAFTQSRFNGALAGAVLGILSVGFLIGAFFALIALILLATSRREFIPECD